MEEGRPVKITPGSDSQLDRKVYAAIAKSLIEFGYSGITPEMIAEVHAAYKEGKRGVDLPHGIIGVFAEHQIEDAIEKGFLK